MKQIDMDITPKKLRQARDLFESMLRRKTKEAEWQAFFAAHPYALTPLVPQRPAVEGFMRLRAKPATLSDSQVKEMLQEKGFYDSDWHRQGQGVKHHYRRQANGQVVHDATTGLTWQQGGSSEYLTFENAQKYIEQINRDGFGGHSDWRLPTLEEAMSLMGP